VDGKAEGYGVYKWADVVVYEVYFKGHEKEGKGTMIDPNGNRYVGEWANGYENGVGELTDAAGNVVFKGQWVFGLCMCVCMRACA
jgi:hypothetical protein